MLPTSGASSSACMLPKGTRSSWPWSLPRRTNLQYQHPISPSVTCSRVLGTDASGPTKEVDIQADLAWNGPAPCPCAMPTSRFSTLLHHCNEHDAIQGLRGLTALQRLYLSGISAPPSDVKQVLETPALEMLQTGLSVNATSSPVFRPYET